MYFFLLMAVLLPGRMYLARHRRSTVLNKSIKSSDTIVTLLPANASFVGRFSEKTWPREIWLEQMYLKKVCKVAAQHSGSCQRYFRGGKMARCEFLKTQQLIKWQLALTSPTNKKVSYELVPLLTHVEPHFAPSWFQCEVQVVVLHKP